MSTEVAIRPEQQQLTVLTNEQLQFIAGTEFVPPGLRGNLPAILACVATGRALGIADMTALRSIHIIDGKATFSAELMVMLARQRGHSIQGSVTEGKATVTGTRKDNGDTMTVEWTLAMAERAGLLGKQNWRKYPEAMLWARAVSQLCRELFPDCFAGATYTLEELGEEHTDAAGDPSDRAGASTGAESAVEASAAEADSSPAVDMSDPDIPFGDAAYQEHQPPGKPATAAQKKKLNVLVGKLRPAHLTTERLYELVGREPVVSEDGELHWSPLRESLTSAEAHELIDRLERVETTSPADEILSLAAEIIGAKPEAAFHIEKHAREHTPEEHLVWLRKQRALLEARRAVA